MIDILPNSAEKITINDLESEKYRNIIMVIFRGKNGD